MHLIRALTLVLIAIVSLSTFAQEIKKPLTTDDRLNTVINSEEQRRIVINHEEQYSVVINHEEQYSIWVEGQKVPSGWKPVGFTGSKEESLQYIEKAWTDIETVSDRRTKALKIYQSNQPKK